MKYTASILSITLVACGNGGGSICPNGSEGCPCTVGGLCDSPFECQGGVCATPAADTGTDPDAPADAVTDTAADAAADDGAEAAACGSDGDCDDSDPCTADTCDTGDGECRHDPVDADGDGYPAMEVEGTACAGGTDCLDDSTTAFPGAPMVDCSPLDNDCNGSPDEDNDGDGHVEWACGTGGDDCVDDDATTLRGECWGVSDCCDGCNQVGGCWLDPATGLLWEDPPMQGGFPPLDAAEAYCAGLSLAGHGAGEWSVPTVGEMRTFVLGCPAIEDGGACGLTDACLDDTCLTGCTGCDSMAGPGSGGCYWDPAVEGICDWYWSSSRFPYNPSSAWILGYEAGLLAVEEGSFGAYVRCVMTGL